jgi:xanthine dehydrogenase large subunit
MVAQVLGIPHAAVTVNMRRMGGGFGGKETQGNLFACVAAVAARKLRRAVKLRPDRDDDFRSPASGTISSSTTMSATMTMGASRR